MQTKLIVAQWDCEQIRAGRAKH